MGDGLWAVDLRVSSQGLFPKFGNWVSLIRTKDFRFGNLLRIETFFHKKKKKKKYGNYQNGCVQLRRAL